MLSSLSFVVYADGGVGDGSLLIGVGGLQRLKKRKQSNQLTFKHNEK